MPRSFHSEESAANRKSLARLDALRIGRLTLFADKAQFNGVHLEEDFFVLLVCLGLNLLRQLDDGLELGVMLLLL